MLGMKFSAPLIQKYGWSFAPVDLKQILNFPMLSSIYIAMNHFFKMNNHVHYLIRDNTTVYIT